MENRIQIIGMSLFCALIVQASTPVPFTAYDFTTSPGGVVATLEFETQADQHYSILRTDNLLSNDWNTVVSELPGTSSNMVYVDTAPLAPTTHFYRASSTSAPPANLIINGDFETPALASGGTNVSANGEWTQDGDRQDIHKAGWAGETGEQGVWLKAFATNLDRSFWQDTVGVAGMEYTLDAAFKFNPNFESNGSTLEMAIIWLNGNGSEISRITLDVNANLDTSEDWKHLNISGIAPPTTATVRAWFHWTTDNTIEISTQSSALVDNVTLFMQSPGAGWGGFNAATRVAAAQYAGLYAAATENSIQISKIEEAALDTFTATNINGMAFTASGRQLFMSTPDSVIAYNAGTGQQSDFITGLSLGSGKLGIAHFKGELFVGTAGGDILRYDAQLDDLTGSYNATVNIGASVRGIAVDIQDQMLYVASPNHLYRLNPTNSVLTQIATVSNMVAISMGRTFGAPGQGGLIILQDTGAQRNLLLVSTADLQAGGSFTPAPYINTSDELKDIAATACGRILSAEPIPEMIADTNDTRMDFMEWVADEFEQNVRFAKTLCWQDGGLTGMVQNAATRWNKNRGSVASPDAAYWVVNQLLMSHNVNGDLEAQGMVREIVKRYSTLYVNSDGQWHHWYDSNTGNLAWNDADPDATTSAYSTMKAIHMAIRAKNYFWYDTEIVEAANTMISRLRNQRDYVREFGKFASPADDMGPVIGGHRPAPYQELHLYSELMAATEPMNENAYLDYWRYRDNHAYNYELPTEPIVKTAMAGFWRMYDQATVAYCRSSNDWKQEFKNFYALYAGWTDDHATEHLTAFSAGQVPDLSKSDPSTTHTYSADKYTYHPGTVNSFGTVIGFGLHGDTVPVVGAYFAYRDGRRQLLEGSANYNDPHLLTRISYDYPTWLMSNISPTDHQYAGYALGELLKPGSIDQTIANHTYLEPQWSVQTNGDYLVEFSQLIKRQIRGTTDGSNWDYLGYQYSPFTVPASAGYTNFMVGGAEGELLQPLSNQTYNVSADFEGTRYIARVLSTNSGPLRVQWYNGTSFISEDTGFQPLETFKPAGATELRADLSGHPFEQITVELDGKPELFSNHGFEDGNLNGWSSTQQTGLSRSNVADSRLEGSRSCEFIATVGAANGNYTQVYREYDISADPTNTHYVLEYDVITENLQGSSLRSTVKVYDATNAQIRDDYFDTLERPDTRTRLSAGFRKRDTDHVKLRFIIRLTRDNATAVTADERVIIDNLRLLKMKP
ncbi:hypothetical protein PDESU_01152 [Pontiella desulfatans]|uniref:CBM-cenC domain-containing protein n=1 Tax=Pontiella desulfatans TaxID=2750659 RepID=A0A6C2TYC6_PONDE|nr:hypothetical protein [Pontiella desulfatans]VGO12599.1 hypothetical protein PDESU_01152 [Pontiella desulfatans]